MDTLAIIKRIEFRLLEIGMDKTEFYAKSGVSSASYSQWNTGKYNPSIKKLHQIAEALDMPVESLTGDSENAQKNPPAISGEGKRAWAKSVIDQISEDDFDSLAPLLRRFGDKYKED